MERSRFNPEDLEVGDIVAEEEPERPFRSLTGGYSWLDYLDVPDFGIGDLDLDEGCLPVLLLGVVVALVAVLISAIVAAPALIGEVFLDA